VCDLSESFDEKMYANGKLAFDQDEEVAFALAQKLGLKGENEVHIGEIRWMGEGSNVGDGLTSVVKVINTVIITN